MLGFPEGTPVRVFIGVGVAVLLLAVLSRGPMGVVGLLPARVHASLDYLLGFLLILIPFLFGFADVEEALYASVLIGVAYLVMTLVTRFPLPGAAQPAAETDAAGDGDGAPGDEYGAS